MATPTRSATAWTRYGTARWPARWRQFVKRLGRLAAPKVAGFYLQREDRWYREKMHPVGALLNDAEKLHTAWQTGQRASVDTRPDPMDAARVARERREARERAAR